MIESTFSQLVTVSWVFLLYDNSCRKRKNRYNDK